MKFSSSPIHSRSLVELSQFHNISSFTVMLEYALSFTQWSGSVAQFQYCVSKNNKKLIIIKQNTHLGTFHKCCLINSHNTSKKYYYPHMLLLQKLEKFLIPHLYSLTETPSYFILSSPSYAFKEYHNLILLSTGRVLMAAATF